MPKVAVVEPFVSPRAISGKELHRSFVRVSTKPRPVWNNADPIHSNLTEQFTCREDVLSYVKAHRDRGFGVTPLAARVINQILAEGDVATYVGTTTQCPATNVSGKKCFYGELLGSARHVLPHRSRVLPRLTALTLLPWFCYDWIEEADTLIPVTETVMLEGREYYPVLLGNGPTLDYREVRSYVLGPETNVVLR